MLHLCPQYPRCICYPPVPYLASSLCYQISSSRTATSNAGFSGTQSELTVINDLRFVICTSSCHRLMTFQFFYSATKYNLRNSRKKTKQKMIWSLLTSPILSLPQLPEFQDLFCRQLLFLRRTSIFEQAFASNKFCLRVALFSFYSGRFFAI